MPNDIPLDVESRLKDAGVEVIEGKDYLEKLSGLKFKDKVSFTLNPSDLVHIHNDHVGGNEKDKGNNIPLTTLDIKRIVDVISFPTAIMYGKEKNSGRNLFYFFKVVYHQTNHSAYINRETGQNWDERDDWDECVDNVWQSFKISLPLRDKIIEDILIALRDGYNNKHNECTNNRGDNNLNGEAKEKTIGNGRGSEYIRYTRGDILTAHQYFLNTDMPFFAGIILIPVMCGWSLVVGRCMPTMMRVLFLIPVMCR